LFNPISYRYYRLVAVILLFSACKSAKKVTTEVPGGISDAAFGFYYIGGCNERAKGNLQEALKLFSECQTIKKDDAAVSYELATVHKMLGHTEQALNFARAAAVAKPSNEWYQLLYIECLNTSRQFAQALKVREALAKRFPEKTEFQEDLAIQYAMMGQYDKSFKIYEELEGTYGVNEQLTLNKVKLLSSQHKFKEAEAELKTLVKGDSLQTRYYAYLADLYLEYNQLEDAKKMYDKILNIDENDVDVHLALHDFYLKKNDETKAFVHLKLAIKNPDLELSVKTNIVASYFIRAEDRFESARKEGLELAEIMLKVHPTSGEANALYADFLRLQKKYAEAAPYYYKAALAKNKDIKVWDNLLFIDNELNRFDSLEHHSSMAIEVFPNQPNYYIYNGVANTQTHNYSKAVVALRSGVDYVVDNKALLIQFYSALGDAYFYLKDFINSDAYFEKALKEDADNTYVLNNYAYYLSQRNEQLEKAERLSKRSNDLSPNNKNYMDTYGWILFQQKKYQAADEWLSKAAKMGQKNATIIEHYADNLFMLGQKEEALKMWQEALNAGGNLEDLSKKIKDKKINGQ
jgi:tetratricopeptide (TPR) repeat protein